MIRVFDVRRIGGGQRVAPLNERGVDHQITYPHVAKKAVEVVGLRNVLLEADGLAFDELPIALACLFAKAAYGTAGIDGLGRIDTYIADTVLHAIDIDANSVTVDDSSYRCGREAGTDVRSGCDRRYTRRFSDFGLAGTADAGECQSDERDVKGCA